jgi:CO/xanthine dehydrogenase Mo-binding subunit
VDRVVHFVPSEAAPTGTGEPGVPPLASAVLNAAFAATGRRLRRLLIRPTDLAWRKLDADVSAPTVAAFMPRT